MSLFEEHEGQSNDSEESGEVGEETEGTSPELVSIISGKDFEVSLWEGGKPDLVVVLVESHVMSLHEIMSESPGVDQSGGLDLERALVRGFEEGIVFWLQAP